MGCRFTDHREYWMADIRFASYLGTQAFPSPGTGEESAFAVVLGDDGSGITLVPTFSNVTPLI